MKIVFLTQPPAGGQDRRETRFVDGVSAALRDQGHQAEARATLDPETDLDDADLVVVHEANDLPLVARIGAHRARHGGYRLLFHDTHPRACTAPREMRRYDLSNYDGVLTPSEAVRCAHLEDGRTERAWIWQEAVDTRLFHPLPTIEPECDVVWIGDWSATRGSDLGALLLRPARQLRMRGHLHISDAPPSTRFRVRLSGLHCCGSVAEAEISAVFARHRLTVDLPQRTETAPGTPTTGFLQALACGIPLISTPWEDTEGLFQVERDYLIARDQAEMREAMQAIAEFPEFADELREHGLATVRAGHTCTHRADELLAIDAGLRGATLELAG